MGGGDFGAMFAAMGLFFLIIWLVVAAILTVPFWFILKRAGFSPFLSLLNLIPGLGTLVVMAILAFAKWPAGESGRRSTVQDVIAQMSGGRR